MKSRCLPNIVPRRQYDNSGSGSGSCLWWSIGLEIKRNHPSIQYAGISDKSRCLARTVLRQLEKDFFASVSVALFQYLQCNYDKDESSKKEQYRNRERYLNRLKGGTSRISQNDWGEDFDIAVAAICIGLPIYSIGRRDGRYKRFHPVEGRCTFVSGSAINEEDVVLFNSGNHHWMPTKVLHG